MVRQRFGKRYVSRGRKGRFTKNVSVGRSLAMDRRTKAKRKVKSGYGDMGDVVTKKVIDCPLDIFK